MTRKTYVKKLMGLGYSRNEANELAKNFLEYKFLFHQGYSYKEEYEITKPMHEIILHYKDYFARCYSFDA